jgi:S-adenosyl methyltransferase
MADGQEWMRPSTRPPVELHTDRPHPARVYDVLLGGKTNYAADRLAAEQTMAALPSAAATARHNRAFMHRVARHLVKDAGIRQFLDIGTGIPTPPNLHEVAQCVAPRSRVVYVDNDPIVLTHSRALHTSHPQGRTAYLHGDLCEPERILRDPELRGTLDLGRPVALTLVAVLHWLPADQDPYAIVRLLMSGLASGSYLALTHATGDFERAAMDEISDTFRRSGANVTTRGKDEVIHFFDGLDLVEPGVQVVQRWRPEETGTLTEPLGDTRIPLYGGVARKP